MGEEIAKAARAGWAVWHEGCAMDENLTLDIDRPLVENFALRQGLHHLAQRKPCQDRSDDFGRLFFQGDCIEMARAMMQLNRNDFDHVTMIGRLLYGDLFDHEKEIRSAQDLLNLLTTFEMCKLAQLAERTASDMLWNGVVRCGPETSIRKDYTGIHHLCVNHERCKLDDFLSVLDELVPPESSCIVAASTLLPLVLDEFQEEMLTLKRDQHCTVALDHGIGDSYACVVPLTEDSQPAVIEHFVDYRAVPVDLGERDFFWTDGGLFAWAVDAEKWDYRLNIITERRVELLGPERTFIIEIMNLEETASQFYKNGS